MTSLVDLPVEVITLILCSDLLLCDLANIRLQCEFFRAIADDIIRQLYCKETLSAGLLDAFPDSHVPILERLVKLRRRENAWTHFKPNGADKDKYVPEITIRSIQDKARLGSRRLNQRMCDFNGNYFLMGVPGVGSAKIITAIYYCRMPSGDQFPPPAGPPDPRTNTGIPKLAFRFCNLHQSEDEEMGNAHSSAHAIDDAQMGSDSGGSSECSVEADEDALMDLIDWDADPSDVNKPSQPAKMTKPHWISVPFVVRPQEEVLGFKLAVEESNLLALVTLSSRRAQSKYILYLFHFPSGHVHPSAALAHIDLVVGRACFDNCCIRLLDGKLGVLLSTTETNQLGDRDGNSVDKFFLFDWRSGVLLMTKSAEDWETYCRFSFLSNDVIVFPNTSGWYIELCNINVDAPASSVTRDRDRPGILTSALILVLPNLKDTAAVWKFACDTQQPSSGSTHGDKDGDSPSFQSPFADGLVVFTFSMEYIYDDNITGDICDIRFVVHKHALLELLSISSSHVAETTSEQPFRMDWLEWGPSRTRWFDVHGSSGDFSPATWGQRVVTVRPKFSHLDRRPIYVYNFNPAAVSAAVSSTGIDVVTSLDPLNINEDWEGMGSHVAFRETIWSGLPYVRTESPFLVGSISGAVMDGDRIILLRSASSLFTGIAWLIVLHMT